MGATVIWSCHVDIDRPNDLARSAWDFLRPYVQAAHAYVFSRPAYCWEGLDRDRLAVIPLCIDAFAPKNQPMARPTVSAILQAVGILDAPTADLPAPVFRHLDGRPGRVVGRAEMIQDEPIPPAVPMVLQVSRWDPLKDPLGVLQGFIGHVPDRLGAHLVLAGPAATSVSDDPESEQVRCSAAPTSSSRRAWPRGSPDRGRGDVESPPGPGQPGRGHPDQITHDRSGLLLDDPSDLAAFGRATATLLEEHERAARLGREAHRRVRQDYLAPRRLTQELDLIQRLTS